MARSPEYPQRIRVASVFEPFIYLFDCSLLVCLIVNFLIFLLLTSSFIVLSPLLFIYKIITVMIDIDTS